MKRTLISALALLGFAACCFLSRSCANTTTPPSGGPKDTIPPVLLTVTPENRTTNFPVIGQKILLLFDEYTVVKTSTDIFVSPPVKKRPSAKVKGKNIVVSFQDSLLPDQTYTIDFGQALADNNEGNLAPRFVYTFSTGETIDSLYFTGKVFDSQTLQPVKGVMVAAYSDLSDSACFLKVPDAAVKTDDWGFFVIRNIKDRPYRIYAYNDEGSDYKYDPDTDNIAFLDSIFTPTAVVRDSIFELGAFDMKDTLECAKREPMISLALFKELQTAQYLQNSGRKTEKSGFLKFSAADVKINSLEFPGIKKENVIIQYSPMRDSLDFWIDVPYRLDDSLMIRLNYMKTDSTGALSPADANLSLAVMRDLEQEKIMEGLTREEKKRLKNKKDTVFKLTTTVSDETVEMDGVTLSSALPVKNIIQDSISLTEKNPKGQTFLKKFSFEQDTMDIRTYHIRPEDALIKGYEYLLRIPQGTFTNLDKLPNALEEIKFQIPGGEDLCILTLNLKNVDNQYIVEVLDESGKTVVRKTTVAGDKSIEFKYMKPGKYMVRLSRDANGNGTVDTGNLLEKRQPEIVKFYATSPESNILEIPESCDIEQDLDIKEIFK